MAQSDEMLLLIDEILSGNLYHSTTVGALERILQSNMLLLGREEPSVSFSRSSRSWHTARLNKVRLILNGEKLRRNYRLTPHIYHKDITTFGKQPGGRFEYEEKSDKPIERLHRYLIGLEILDRDFIENNPQIVHLLTTKYPDVKLYFHPWHNEPPKEYVSSYHSIPVTTDYHKFRKDLSQQESFNVDEANYQGLLYHTTTTGAIHSILQSHKLITTGTHTKHISFSRTRSFWFGGQQARLVLDGTRMAHDYKLDPYVGGSKSKGWSGYSAFRKEPGGEFEYELELRGRELKNLERYLLAIELSPNTHLHQAEIDDLKNALSEEGYHNVKIMAGMSKAGDKPTGYPPFNIDVQYHKQQQEIEKGIAPSRSLFTPRGKKKQYTLGVPHKDVRTLIPGLRKAYNKQNFSGIDKLVKESGLSLEKLKTIGKDLTSWGNISYESFLDVVYDHNSDIRYSVIQKIWDYFKNMGILIGKDPFGEFKIDQDVLYNWIWDKKSVSKKKVEPKKEKNFIFYVGHLEGNVAPWIVLRKAITNATILGHYASTPFSYVLGQNHYVAKNEYVPHLDETIFHFGFAKDTFSTAIQAEKLLIAKAKELKLKYLIKYVCNWDPETSTAKVLEEHTIIQGGTHNRRDKEGDQDILGDILQTAYTHDAAVKGQAGTEKILYLGHSIYDDIYPVLKAHMSNHLFQHYSHSGMTLKTGPPHVSSTHISPGYDSASGTYTFFFVFDKTNKEEEVWGLALEQLLKNGAESFGLEQLVKQDLKYHSKDNFHEVIDQSVVFTKKEKLEKKVSAHDVIHTISSMSGDPFTWLIAKSTMKYKDFRDTLVEKFGINILDHTVDAVFLFYEYNGHKKDIQIGNLLGGGSQVVFSYNSHYSSSYKHTLTDIQKHSLDLKLTHLETCVGSYDEKTGVYHAKDYDVNL